MSKTRTITRLRRQLTTAHTALADLRQRITELEDANDDLESELEAYANAATRATRAARAARAEADAAQQQYENYQYWVSDQVRNLEHYERYGDTCRANRTRKSLAQSW